MPRKISLLVIAAAFGASLALGPGAIAADMAGGGRGDASGGAQSGFGGPSGSTAHGGFASPGGGPGSGGHSGQGGPSASARDTTHSQGGAGDSDRGDSRRGGATGRATGFGATAPGTPTVSSGAKSAIVAPGAAARRGPGTSHVRGGSVAGDFRFRRHRDRFHHHAIPFVFVTGIETVPVATEAGPAVEPAIGSQTFTVSNDTDSEMTVLDSGVQICVLAPRARCSFETTSGHHDISVTISGRQSSDLGDRGSHGGHMIEVGRAAN